MKRPLFTIGLTALLVMAVLFYLPMKGIAVLGVASAMTGMGLLFVRKKNVKIGTFLTVLFTVAICCGTFYVYTEMRVVPIEKLVGQKLPAQGLVTDLKRDDRKDTCTVLVNFPNSDAPSNVSVTVYLKPYSGIELGDVIAFEALLNSPEIPSGELNVQSYGKGILLTAMVWEKYQLVEENAGHPLRQALCKFRQKLWDQAGNLYASPMDSVIQRLLLGNRSPLDGSLETDFSRSGIYHLLSISGLHVSILAQLLLVALNALKLSKRKSSICAILFLWLFAGMLGFSTAVTRATVMLSVYLFAQILLTESDSLSALGLAALVLLLPNPYGIQQVGFQLSFAGTFGILVGYQKVMDFFKAKTRKPGSAVFRACLSALCTTLCAYVFTLPIMMLNFGYVSLIGPLANTLLVPLAPFILGPGILSLLIGLVPPLFWLAKLFAVIAESVGGILLVGAKFFAAFPLAAVGNLKDAAILWVFLCYVGAILLFWLHTSRRLKLVCGILALAVLAGGITADKILSKNALTVVSIDNCLVLVHDHRAAAIGTIENTVAAENIIEYLQWERIAALDLVLLGSATTDSQGGVKALLSEIPAQTVILPSEGAATPFIQQALGSAQVEPLRSMRIHWLDGLSLWTECSGDEVDIYLEAQSQRLLKSSREYDIIKEMSNLQWDLLYTEDDLPVYRGAKEEQIHFRQLHGNGWWETSLFLA